MLVTIAMINLVAFPFGAEELTSIHSFTPRWAWARSAARSTPWAVSSDVSPPMPKWNHVAQYGWLRIPGNEPTVKIHESERTINEPDWKADRESDRQERARSRLERWALEAHQVPSAITRFFTEFGERTRTNIKLAGQVATHMQTESDLSIFPREVSLWRLDITLISEIILARAYLNV